jgi:integrase
LGLKVLPSGKKVWLLQTKFPGHTVQTKRKLGEYPVTSLADARAKAEKWRGLAKKGIDPTEAEEEEAREKAAARRAEALRREHTFAAVAERYVTERQDYRRARAESQEIERLIKAWDKSGEPIHKITPRDVRTVIEKIKQYAPYDARNMWTHLTGIFKKAVHDELIDVSPVASLDRKLVFKGAKIKHRERWLNETEIFAFWRATARLGPPAREFLRLLLLTGVRTSELADARWNEFHPELRRLIRDARRANVRVDWAAVAPEVKRWVVPSERFKSEREHLVPLPDDALCILETLPAGDYLFTLSGRKTPVWFGSKIKRRLDVRMARTLRALARRRGENPDAVRLSPWVLHDTRRTIRSNMSALKIADHIAEMCLGHGRKGITAVYDQYKFADEMREAREAWAAKVHRIVERALTATPTNVVSLLKPKRANGSF